MRKNLTFCGGEPFWANACVGNNGAPNYYTYAKGFSEAANLLIKAALSKNGSKYPVDTFIYPICFNMRHSVELRLKGAVVNLVAIAKLRNPLPAFNLEGSHDVGRIWEYFKSGAEKTDGRIGLYVHVLNDYMLDLADVDATGQTFRYPSDVDEKKHLIEIDTINVALLYKRFNALERYLDSLENFMRELRDEYALKTYTKRLGRSQILSIAKELPRKELWGESEFKVLKEKIKSEYNIGSKEFSEVLNKIPLVYRTAGSGVPSPELRYLNISDLKSIVGDWIKLNPLASREEGEVIQSLDLGDVEEVSRAFERIIERDANLDEVVAGLSGLEADKVADINAIYEAVDSSYPEMYPFLVDYYREQYQKSGLYYEREKEFSLRRLMKKGDFLDKLLRCLFLIGHKAKAEELIGEFKLEGHIKWLEAMRSEEYFVSPCDGILFSCIEIHKEVLGEVAHEE